MEIVKIEDKSLADICDDMLTCLIIDEKKYDTNISENLVIRDWYSTTLDDKHRVSFAAIEQGEAIGFIHGFIKDKAGAFVNDTVITLDAMYVKDKHRGFGIGTALIEEFKKWGTSADAKYIDLTVLVDNCSAVELYRKQGFIPLKSHMRFTLK